MKSFVINFTGENEKNSYDADTIVDACIIKGQVLSDATNLTGRTDTAVTLEISSVLPNGAPFEWGSTQLELRCEASTNEAGHHVVTIWLERGDG